MDYIFNVRAQFVDNLSSLKTQYSNTKKSIEENVIKVKAILDPSSLTLKSVQEQLNKQNLTINVGDIKFNNTGLESVRNEMQQVANTTQNVTQQTQQAKQAVNGLTAEYKKLSLEAVNSEFGQAGRLSSSMGISAEYLDTQESIKAMRAIKAEYESVWGKGMVDITARTETSTHAINGFTVAVKNAENQLYKFRYSANQNKDTGLWSFDYNGSTFGDSAIQKTKEQTRELEKQDATLRKLTDDLDKYVSTYHKQTQPILGIDISDVDTGEKVLKNRMSLNEEYGKSSEELQNKLRQYQSIYNELRADIENYQKSVKDGIPVEQSAIDSIQAKKVALENLAKEIKQGQYTQTSMQGKTVETQKSIVGDELKAFRNDVINSNLVSEEFVKEIDKVNHALQNAGDSAQFRKAYEELRKLESEFKSYQQMAKSDATKESFNVDYAKASSSLDSIIKKIQELGNGESDLTFKTTDLLEAFSNISDRYSLQTFNKMLAQATKEVNSQTQELQTQEKEWQRLTDLANNAYANATNSSKNSNALENAESIKLLRTQYNTVIEAVDKLKSSTSETFADNKKSAEQAIQALTDYARVLQDSEQNINATDNAIKKLQSDTQKGLFAQNSNNSEVVQLRQDITDLSNQYSQLQAKFQNEGATQEVIAGFTQLDNQIKSTSERAKELKQSLTSARDAAALEDRKSNLNNKIETWLRNNTRASESMRQSMKALQTQIQSADKSTLTHLTQQFNELNRTAQQTGQIGKDLKDIFKEKAIKFAGWFGLANAFMWVANEAKQAVVTFKDVDSILTEISKTSERSAESLEKLGESAFDAASKYGVSVQNYLTGVQEMARAGYEVYGEERSAQLAELALLIQSAGDTTDAVARDALIATDAAYQLGGDVEKLTRIFDGFNKITNNSAISMNDMASAIKETAAIANNYGVTVEQLSALIATATAKTRQSGAETGNAIKSLLVTLSDVTNGTVVKAFDAVGVSMYKFVDGSKQLKTPIELLEELSKVFNELPQGDDRRSILLNDIGGRIYCHYVQKCA